MSYNMVKVKYGTSFYDWSQMEGNEHGKKLMNEWNRDRNIFELHTNSKHVSYSNSKEVWWTCSKCGKDFKAAVCKRVHNNLQCPHCKKQRGTSVPEQGLFEVFKNLYPDTVSRDRHLGFEIDIYIPELKIGIEYNGSYYHKILCDKTVRDRLKAEICKEKGITLIQVWDDGELETPILDTDGLTIRFKYRANRLYDQLVAISNLIINEIIQIEIKKRIECIEMVSYAV